MDQLLTPQTEVSQSCCAKHPPCLEAALGQIHDQLRAAHHLCGLDRDFVAKGASSTTHLMRVDPTTSPLKLSPPPFSNAPIKAVSVIVLEGKVTQATTQHLYLDPSRSFLRLSSNTDKKLKLETNRSMGSRTQLHTAAHKVGSNERGALFN